MSAPDSEETMWVLQHVHGGVVETPQLFRNEENATSAFCQRAENLGFARLPGESDDDMYFSFLTCDAIARGLECDPEQDTPANRQRAWESKFDFQDDELHLWFLSIT